MRELNDAQSIIEAAKEAAAANDYISAEALLRKAVLLQETDPPHPDLASTVNNLGIVCEINDKPAVAEACFRRAVSIATHTLGPDHPLTATSRQNLRDFCEARGKPFELPKLLPAVTTATKTAADVPAAKTAADVPAAKTAADVPAAKAAPDVAAAKTASGVPVAKRALDVPTVKTAPDVPADQARPPLAVSPVTRSVQRVARKRPIRPFVMGALGPGLMLIAIVAARPWLGAPEGHESSPAAVREPVPTIAAPAPPVSSTFKPTPVATEPVQDAESVAAAADDSPITASTMPDRPTVVRAQLCAALEDWHCDPPDRPIPPGQLFFYTQVKTANAAVVQHRWYQGDRLLHSVDLRVDASPKVGYRSFSRYTMKNENAGNWKVELRTEDGVLLQEERFSVQ